MIRAVIFDAQGTLFNSIPKNEKIQDILKAQGRDVSLSDIDSALSASKRIFDLLHSKGLASLDNKGYLLGNEIRMVLLGFDAKEAEVLAGIVNEQWTDAGKRKPFPEVVQVLESLRKNNYKIGLLTAGAAISYSKTLKDTGLMDYFSFVVGEDTTNVPKPDPRAYRHVIEQSGCDPGEILFVGDDLVNDYEGPRRSGMKSVLVDRENRYGKDKILKISSLEPLSTKEFFDTLE